MTIYRYERRLFLVVEGPNGIKQSNKIIPENKELLDYATYPRANASWLVD